MTREMPGEALLAAREAADMLVGEPEERLRYCLGKKGLLAPKCGLTPDEIETLLKRMKGATK